MGEAPERIWAVERTEDVGIWWEECDEGGIEYTRADLSLAHVAVMLEKAAKVVEPIEEEEPDCDPSNHGDTANLAAWKEGMWNARAIRNLIPADAQAALDAVRAEERERCAKKIEARITADMHPNSLIVWMLKDIVKDLREAGHE